MHIQYRRKIGTVIEVILPIVFFGIMVYLKTTVVNEKGGPGMNILVIRRIVLVYILIATLKVYTFIAT